MTSTITHPLLGEITVSQTMRAKRISLSVRPPARIRLSLPHYVSLREAMRFVDSRQEWVRQAIEKYAAKSPPEIITMPYSTRKHHLQLNPCQTDRIRAHIRKREIIVDYPLSKHYMDTDVQQEIKRGIEEAWRAEAKVLLPIRLEELSRQTGLRYGKVSVRKTVSRWGSCSANDDISLSVHLMRLPDHLIDYILVHELCHTVHKNHGPKFHELLDHHTGGRHRQLEKETKQFHTRW